MSSLEEARSRFEAGEFPAAREAALAELERSPDDVELLRIAGWAGVEIGSADAVELLRRVAELEPSSAEAWSDLGDALATDGLNEEAAQAFAKAVEIDPGNDVARAQLGSAEFAAGKGEAAIANLEQAAGRLGAASSAAISLVEMHRAFGQPEKALEAALEVAAGQPDDVRAQLDVADLALELGRLDEAEAAFQATRQADEIAEHEVYALQGLALIAMRRGDTNRALEFAREALAIDERGLSAELALHLDVATGGSGEILAGRASTIVMRMPPIQDEVEAALLASLAEHRALHADDRLTAQDIG